MLAWVMNLGFAGSGAAAPADNSPYYADAVDVYIPGAVAAEVDG